MWWSCPIRSLRKPEGEGGAIEVKRLFYGDASSVGEARSFVRDALAATDAPAVVVDSAVLLISELATNVTLHARTDLQVSIRFEDDTLRGEVKDWNSRLPQPCTAPEGATTGRGLTLVESLAHRWGIDQDDGGKTVWFSLKVDRSVPVDGS
jgi:anti-sigma regulatory factor (Ser/Thr protein kinase)